MDILRELENKSTREAEKIVLGLSSLVHAGQERIRPIAEEFVEIKFTAPERVQKKIEKLKGLLAHKYPNISLADLVEKICDLGLETWNPAAETAAPRKHREKSSQEEIATAPENMATEKNSEKPRNRYISPTIRKEVWRRAHGQCENCGSNYALQTEHIIPFAKGGMSTIENLRLLCRTCNQRSAVKEYGALKMEQYWN